MQAAGDHLILRVPTKIQRTEGGIVLETVDQHWSYGRILSIAPAARLALGEYTDQFTHAVFDPSGTYVLALDPLKSDNTVLRAMSCSNIFALLTDADLQELGLPAA